MDTLSAFIQSEAARARGSQQRVFDWNEAARRIVERGAVRAVAGLSTDMEYTAGAIYEEGIVPQEETYIYLSSNWATPVLVLDDGPEEECWVVPGRERLERQDVLAQVCTSDLESREEVSSRNRELWEPLSVTHEWPRVSDEDRPKTDGMEGRWTN